MLKAMCDTLFSAMWLVAVLNAVRRTPRIRFSLELGWGRQPC